MTSSITSATTSASKLPTQRPTSQNAAPTWKPRPDPMPPIGDDRKRLTQALKDAIAGAIPATPTPPTSPTPTTPTTPTSYTVQPGDSYWAIAERNPVPGISTTDRVAELIALNAPRLTGTPDSTMLHPGQEVLIPGGTAAPAVPAPASPMPSPFPTDAEPVDSTGGAGGPAVEAPGEQTTERRQGVVDSVLDKLGTPYVFGAAGPDAYDCSGLTRAVLQEFGIDVPHKALWQSQQGPHIGRDQLQPGDLVFFQNSEQSDIGHVGVYIGDGQFVHAPNSGSVVRIDNLDSSYYQGTFQFGVSLDSL